MTFLKGKDRKEKRELVACVILMLYGGVSCICAVVSLFSNFDWRVFILLIVSILMVVGSLYYYRSSCKNLNLFSIVSIIYLILVLNAPLVWLHVFAPQTESVSYYGSCIKIILFLCILIGLSVFGTLAFDRKLSYMIFTILYILYFVIDNVPNNAALLWFLEISNYTSDDYTVSLLSVFNEATREAFLCYIIFDTYVQEREKRKEEKQAEKNWHLLEMQNANEQSKLSLDKSTNEHRKRVFYLCGATALVATTATVTRIIVRSSKRKLP